jgi:hypothetical protein
MPEDVAAEVVAAEVVAAEAMSADAAPDAADAQPGGPQ